MKNLRKARKDNGLSMKELGERIGAAESTISLYETGKRQPDNDTIIKLSKTLDCTTDYLLGLSENKKMPADEIVNEHKQKIIDYLSDLTPEEFVHVQHFVSSLRALNKDSQSHNQ